METKYIVLIIYIIGVIIAFNELSKYCTSPMDVNDVEIKSNRLELITAWLVAIFISLLSWLTVIAIFVVKIFNL